MQIPLKKFSLPALALFIMLMVSVDASAQATIVILNNDAAGAGFNDATPATPVGGNSGTTVGQQRLIAFQAAANIWGATLTSGPTITIRSTWAALPCTATTGTLGSAGNTGNIWRDFSGAVPGFFYGNALANAITGRDLNDTTSGAVAGPEINAQFNVNLGTPGCLETASWYYGLDNNHGPTGIDLVNVLLHEFAHGLGFQTFTNRTTGQLAGSEANGRFPSIYDRYLFDKTVGKTWAQMNDGERVSSAINTGNLVWNGPQVVNDVPGVLSGTPRLRVNSPAAIAGNYQVGTASFGPAMSPAGTSGEVVQTIPSDGCTPITNSVAGKIALIDRGNCTFASKTKNAQNAGATAVIIVDNVASATPPGMGGTDATITIPTVSVTQANGNTIKGQLPTGVNATLFADTSALAGADSARRPLMYAPNPLESGSSVSHWDTSLLRNQLMEPNIAGDLTQSVAPPFDLTLSLFKDIGWLAPITIMVEFGTNPALVAAVDSVTQTRGPFANTNQHNLGNGDTRRRIIFFTTSLGLNPTDNLSVLSVRASGIPLVVESTGPNAGVAGTSYIVVRTDGLPQGDYNLSVICRGVASTNSPILRMIP